VDDSRLTAGEFEKVKIAETIETRGEKSCRPLHSPLWQADSDKIRRMAPIEFIGRYMPEWFDYAICDEIHQLAGDTAQGNALGTLASCTDRIVGLTGTLLGGYADDLFKTLFRLEARRMKEHGYEWGTTGRSSFIQDYGVLETITKVEPANNACSKAKATSTVRRSPEPHRCCLASSSCSYAPLCFWKISRGNCPHTRRPISACRWTLPCGRRTAISKRTCGGR